MVNGVHCPGSDTSALSWALPSICLARLSGAVENTSSSPPWSALKAAVSEAKESMIVTWSRWGSPCWW